MGHCLTQPEEIDHILMAMAGNEMGADTPNPDGVQSSKASRNIERDGITRVADTSYEVAHKKPALGLSDP